MNGSRFLILLASIILYAASSVAAVPAITPSTKGSKGLLSVSYPSTLEPEQIIYSFTLTPQNLENGAVENQTLSSGIGIGLFECIELNVGLSYLWLEQFDRSANNAAFPFALTSDGLRSAGGYGHLGVKLRFMNKKAIKIAGALTYEKKLSSYKLGVTTGRSRYEPQLLLSTHIIPRTTIAVNTGFRYQPRSKKLDWKPGHAVTYAAGVETELFSNIAALFQVSGSGYVGENVPQRNPVHLTAGLRYNLMDKYRNPVFGISLAYKRNLNYKSTFMKPDGNEAAKQGFTASIWFIRGSLRNNCHFKDAKIKELTITEGKRVKTDIHGYKIRVKPQRALTNSFGPVLYTWRCSVNGIILKQGTPDTLIRWNANNVTVTESWVEVTVSNKCSTETAMMHLSPDGNVVKQED